MWKISQGLVTGYTVDFTSGGARRGIYIIPKEVNRNAPSQVKAARDRTLGVRGAQIFNLLPVWLRTMNGVTVDRFKSELDKFLSGVPDQPTLPGRGRAAATNSLLDQLQLIF